jgi:hypothetical protein
MVGAVDERREVVDLGLIERFGRGASALSPFEDALAQRASAGARLGELLLGEGVLRPHELAEALAEQAVRRPRKPLGEILLERAVVPAPLLVGALARQCRRELEEEGGFGTGLRRAIEDRHRRVRVQATPA